MTKILEVVIPAYNAEQFLAEAVVSCLQNEVHRITVVDDKSTDQTLEVCKELVEEHRPRVQTIALAENVGQYAACNTIFARFADDVEFIGMLDADDICTPDRFRQTMKAFAANPAQAIIAGQMETIDQGGQKTGGSYDTLPPDPALILARESRHVLINGVMTFRRRVLDVLGGYDAASGGADSEFIIRAFYAELKMHNLKDVLGYRRVHRGQCTSTSRTDPERAAYRTKIAGEWTWWRALKLRGRLQQAHLKIHPVTAVIDHIIH